VIGVSGVGKSTTINAMFKTNLPMSHVVACTKEFLSIDLTAGIQDKGVAHGEAAVLRIVDAPGLGEDIRRDSDYLDMYSNHLSKCDVVLWIISARNRGIALDQRYLQVLTQYHDKIIFGMNQIELIEPLNWSRINMPSLEQEENIKIILDDRRERLQSAFNATAVLSSYSALKGYNLQELFTQLIEHCKSERSWMFGALKGFHPDDFIPAEYRSVVEAAIARRT
jgi:predicted GTPase